MIYHGPHGNNGLEGIEWRIEIFSWYCVCDVSQMKWMWSSCKCKCVVIERRFLNLININAYDGMRRVL